MKEDFPQLTFDVHRVCNLDPRELVQYLESCIESGRRVRIEGLNVAKFIQARSDTDLQQALVEAEILHVDGAGIALAARILGLPLQPRIAGIDLMRELCQVCARNGWSVYLLGAKNEVVREAAVALEKNFPGLQIAGFRDGYFSDSDIPKIVSDIAESAPRLLLIGISSPKKELFVRDNWLQLNTAVAFGVGGSFDVVSGRIHRAPSWMQRFGLEWMFRLLQEPRRLFWRYLSTNTLFFVQVVRMLLKKRLVATRSE